MLKIDIGDSQRWSSVFWPMKCPFSWSMKVCKRAAFCFCFAEQAFFVKDCFKVVSCPGGEFLLILCKATIISIVGLTSLNCHFLDERWLATWDRIGHLFHKRHQPWCPRQFYLLELDNEEEEFWERKNLIGRPDQWEGLNKWPAVITWEVGRRKKFQISGLAAAGIVNCLKHWIRSWNHLTNSRSPTTMFYMFYTKGEIFFIIEFRIFEACCWNDTAIKRSDIVLYFTGQPPLVLSSNILSNIDCNIKCVELCSGWKFSPKKSQFLISVSQCAALSVETLMHYLQLEAISHQLKINIGLEIAIFLLAAKTLW